MADSVSRGYWSIREVVERMEPLKDWTRRFKPQQMHLTLARKDYDLIKRWPRAAHPFGITVMSTGEVWWDGLELTYDGGPRRYAKPAGPVQVDIEQVAR